MRTARRTENKTRGQVTAGAGRVVVMGRGIVVKGGGGVALSECLWPEAQAPTRAGEPKQRPTHRKQHRGRCRVGVRAPWGGTESTPAPLQVRTPVGRPWAPCGHHTGGQSRHARRGGEVTAPPQAVGRSVHRSLTAQGVRSLEGKALQRATLRPGSREPSANAGGICLSDVSALEAHEETIGTAERDWDRSSWY